MFLSFMTSRKISKKNQFADFIRNAKSHEKKRIYSTVLDEVAKQQGRVIAAANPQS